MSQENWEIVRTSVVVVIAACLLKVAIDGAPPWDKTTADTTAQVSEATTLDAAPAIKSCGNFPGVPGSIPIKVEVVEGNIPCRVARRVTKDQYWEVPTGLGVVKGQYRGGLWSCGGLGVGRLITECEEDRGRRGTIRARLYCRYWGPFQSRCLNTFGQP